jgi:MFS family permease
MLEDMGAIENRVYRAYWNDGLLDVFAAVGVLAIGIAWTFDFVVGGAITPALLVPLWGPFRQRFIEPRLGMVEFSDERERTNRGRLRLVFLLGVGTFALGVSLYVLHDRLALYPAVSLIAGLPAFLLAILAALTALLVSTGRFLVYAALLAVGGGIGAATGWEPGKIMVFAGIPILLIASTVLVRFLRKNPVAIEGPE